MKVIGVINLFIFVFVGIEAGKWVPAYNLMNLPSNSVQAGNEDQWIVYVGRLVLIN